jgi:hypothetical protein
LNSVYPAGAVSTIGWDRIHRLSIV